MVAYCCHSFQPTAAGSCPLWWAVHRPTLNYLHPPR